jgi:hypothetical protein
MLVWEATIF